MKNLIISIPLLLMAFIPVNAQKAKYLIAYNVGVPIDSNKVNYEIFSMNLDGSNKKISPTTKTWHGRIMLIKTACFLSAIGIRAIVAIFYMKWILKGKISEKYPICNWKTVGWAAEIKAVNWWYQAE
jgi:hypothetical protein